MPGETGIGQENLNWGIYRSSDDGETWRGIDSKEFNTDKLENAAGILLDDVTGKKYVSYLGAEDKICVRISLTDFHKDEQEKFKPGETGIQTDDSGIRVIETDFTAKNTTVLIQRDPISGCLYLIDIPIGGLNRHHHLNETDGSWAAAVFMPDTCPVCGGTISGPYPHIHS